MTIMSSFSVELSADERETLCDAYTILSNIQSHIPSCVKTLTSPDDATRIRSTDLPAMLSALERFTESNYFIGE